MRPGGYHEAGSHTELSQGTAVARRCPLPPKKSQNALSTLLLTTLVQPIGGSTIMLNHMHGVPTFPANIPTMISVEKRDFEHILYFKIAPLRLPLQP